MNAVSKHVTACGLAALVLFGTFSCGGGGSDSPVTPPKPTPVLTTLNMSASAATLSAKQTTQLSVTTLDQNAQPIAATVMWMTSAGAVATVSSAGLVTAVAPGTATVTASATAGGVTLSGATALTVIAAAGVPRVAVTPPPPSPLRRAPGAPDRPLGPGPGRAPARTLLFA